MDRTTTDEDPGRASAEFMHGFPDDCGDAEPDLSVDGLSESFLMRLVRRLTVRRNA